MGSKYSEHVYKDGKVMDEEIKKENKIEQLKTLSNTKEFWTVFNKEISHNYSRPMTLGMN